MAFPRLLRIAPNVAHTIREMLFVTHKAIEIVPPGITGLAQVRGFRGEARNSSDIENRVACDIAYLENWNLSLDCGIILRTFVHVIIPPRSAY